MIYGVYTVRDLLTGFMSLSLDVNDPSARRNFAHAVNRADSLFNSHPEHYVLYKVGTFDTEKGEICPCDHEIITDAVSEKEV